MPTHLPIPLAYYPRTEQDLAAAGERLGGEVSLHVGPLVEKTVVLNGAPHTKRQPSFVEWWLEYPAVFILAGSAPPPPAEDRVRELLATTARIAASAWVKELERTRPGQAQARCAARPAPAAARRPADPGPRDRRS